MGNPWSFAEVDIRATIQVLSEDINPEIELSQLPDYTVIPHTILPLEACFHTDFPRNLHYTES